MSETDFSQNVLAPIRAVVGEDGIITDPHAMEPFLNSWRDNWRGRSPLIGRPRTTDEMARGRAVAGADFSK